jgi:UDP-glucose 4-epimerase
MPVYGDGSQTRDFCYVSDVVDGMIRAGSLAGISGRVYNIAGGRPASVVDLGRTLATLMGKPPDFDFHPPRPGDIRHSYADVEAARRDLGFAAAVSLEEGLRRTMARRPS